MLRTLTRRGASVLVTAALIGGVVALGGGTASADATGSAGDLPRFSPLDWPAALVLGIGMAAGSVDPNAGECNMGGLAECPSNTEFLLDLLVGNESS